MRILGLVACLALAGCTKKPVEHDVARPVDAPTTTVRTADAATQVVIAGSGSATPAAPPVAAPVSDDCKIALNKLMSNVRRAYIAMDSATPHKQAMKDWPAMPAACRNGRWYLAAALLIDLGDKELAAGSVKLTTEEAALTEALKQPDDLDVLARVALVSALGRGPKLPDDACKRARAGIADNAPREAVDAAGYVCARAAIAAGDGKTAKQELAALKVPATFIDIELARAQAAKLVKDTKTQKAQAKLATKIASQRAMSALVNESDRQAIIAAAKQLAAGT